MTEQPHTKILASTDQLRFLQDQLRAGIVWAELAMELKGYEINAKVQQRYARMLHDSAVMSLTLLHIPQQYCRQIHSDLCCLWLALNHLDEWDETYLLRLKINGNVSCYQN